MIDPDDVWFHVYRCDYTLWHQSNSIRVYANKPYVVAISREPLDRFNRYRLITTYFMRDAYDHPLIDSTEIPTWKTLLTILARSKECYPRPTYKSMKVLIDGTPASFLDLQWLDTRPGHFVRITTINCSNPTDHIDFFGPIGEFNDYIAASIQRVDLPTKPNEEP